ncbi:hypothetical protein BDZ89DRAFT_942711, partial [Hymenopellis radicata]
DFESQLKDIVQAKRLSASKMTKLTEIAMKSMSDDTQLVSILYRTHKSLQSSYKVSSLYVFDALARAAKHKVVKQELSAHSTSGNCATFLSKVEGVLDGLFQDMLSSGHQEFKDKTKKILDIWTKGKTFPETTLSRLTKLLSVTNKGAYLKLDMYSLSTSSTYTTPFPFICTQCKFSQIEELELKSHWFVSRRTRKHCCGAGGSSDCCRTSAAYSRGTDYHAHTASGASGHKRVIITASACCSVRCHCGPKFTVSDPPF